MTKEELVEQCRVIVDKFVNNFKSNRMDDSDKYLYSLLKELIIVEPSTISTDIVFSQLKESYFQTDLATAVFIVKLYTKNSETIQEYIDIYLEQIVENTLTETDIKNKIDIMRLFIKENYPNLVDIYEQKTKQIGNNYKA